ncbi:aldose 1-epimerase family protein [Jiangella asiatica]|uniref:DUF4432 family protein n=1 Tax=Jiangella asiatica TaxID=2530372 RepID=A0A4R5DT38_9ACTN|nr:aldose 1-epimerase family protein [Jiangella asiatica]TDE14295.1 DUF4432 family protein [Jiangella asiatica]
MVMLFGLAGEEAMLRIGSLDQLAYAESLVEENGPGRGGRRLRLVNGSGLELELHPDRALDLGRVTAWGTPLAWRSAAGFPVPVTHPAQGLGWLESFGGGLLTTCGLDTFGAPCQDDGEDFGLHGRVGGLPARIRRLDVTDRAVVVEGDVHQVRVLHQNLRLRRRVQLPLGEPAFTVRDTVTNLGPADTAHMILYHCNFGWPLIEEGTELLIASTVVEPRDEAAHEGLDEWNRIEPPAPGVPERVFRHVIDSPRPTVVIRNPRLGIQVSLLYSAITLGSLYQWKMMRNSDYVLGIEPANCPTLLGRGAARQLGVLPMLRAGQSVEYDLEFRVERLC